MADKGRGRFPAFASSFVPGRGMAGWWGEEMMRPAKIWIEVGVVAAMVAGCTTLPADYATTLSNQDRTWGRRSANKSARRL